MENQLQIEDIRPRGCVTLGKEAVGAAQAKGFSREQAEQEAVLALSQPPAATR